MDADVGWKKFLGNVEDFAAVCSVPVFGEMLVEMLLEPDVVALGRIVGGRCESPAHVSLPRGVVLTCVFVHVMLGDLVELLPDIVRDDLDDLGVGFCGIELVAKECLVEGEDALDFDAEGDLEGGVDHLDGVCGGYLDVVSRCRYDSESEVHGVSLCDFGAEMCVDVPWTYISKLETWMQSPTGRGIRGRSWLLDG